MSPSSQVMASASAERVTLNLKSNQMTVSVVSTPRVSRGATDLQEVPAAPLHSGQATAPTRAAGRTQTLWTLIDSLVCAFAR